MDFKNKNLLFLGAHLDDIELGCGGIISKYGKDAYTNIYLATMSNFNKDSSGNITISRDIEETYRACKILGIDKDRIEINDIPAQLFEQYSQNIREILLDIRERIKADYVFFPSKNDIHQDHTVLCKESERIFRNNICLGYELIRSTYHLKPNIYIEISEKDIENKISSAMQYKSQQTQSAAYYFNEEIIKSTAIFRGGQCNRKYAEAFELYYATI